MSEMECRVGKATPIDMPEGLSHPEQIAYLKEQGFVFEDEEENWAYCEKLEQVNGQWYRIDYKEFDPYGDIAGTKNEDGSIDFVCLWYNGGAGFNEVFEEAVKRAESAEK